MGRYRIIHEGPLLAPGGSILGLKISSCSREKEQGIGQKRLSSFLFPRYGHEFSMYTVKKEKIRTKAKTVRQQCDTSMIMSI